MSHPPKNLSVSKKLNLYQLSTKKTELPLQNNYIYKLCLLLFVNKGNYIILVYG